MCCTFSCGTHILDDSLRPGHAHTAITHNTIAKVDEADILYARAATIDRCIYTAIHVWSYQLCFLPSRDLGKDFEVKMFHWFGVSTVNSSPFGWLRKRRCEKHGLTISYHSKILEML